MASHGGKGCKLRGTVPHRHLRMALRHVMWQVNDIVVIIHFQCLMFNFLRLVSSYLFVAVFGSGPLREVESTEDGVLAKALLDFQLCLLQAALLVQTGLLLLLLFFQGFVVVKQVELPGFFVLCGNG